VAITVTSCEKNMWVVSCSPVILHVWRKVPSDPEKSGFLIHAPRFGLTLPLLKSVFKLSHDFYSTALQYLNAWGVHFDNFIMLNVCFWKLFHRERKFKRLYISSLLKQMLKAVYWCNIFIKGICYERENKEMGHEQC
jgi:hypothetical protein